MKNVFYFILKAVFVLNIFNFLCYLLGHAEKTACFLSFQLLPFYGNIVEVHYETDRSTCKMIDYTAWKTTVIYNAVLVMVHVSIKLNFKQKFLYL